MSPFVDGRGQRMYAHYGAPGSIAWKAGGVAVLEQQRQERDDKQREKKLVEVFDFLPPGSGYKYDCNNYYCHIDQAILEIRKHFSLKDGCFIRARYNNGKYLPDKDGELVDLSMLRQLTLNDGQITRFKLWEE